MKVVTILGSPRKKGNSNTIAMAFNETAHSLGAEVQTFFLNKMNYKGCQGCGACKLKAERCVVKDDLSQVLDAIYEADIVVVASPVYFYDVSGQLKNFVDRTFSFFHPDFMDRPDPSRLPSRKKGLLILAQGDTQDVHRDIPKKYDTFMAFWGLEPRQVIRATEVSFESTDADRRVYVDQARSIAQNWLG